MFYLRILPKNGAYTRNYSLMKIFEIQHKIVKQVNKDIQKQQFMLEMKKYGLNGKCKSQALCMNTSCPFNKHNSITNHIYEAKKY